MKRIQLAASGWALSCLLAACGGSGTDAGTQDATTQAQEAQATLTKQAQAQRRPVPQQFAHGLREVNDTIAWSQTEVTVGGVNATRVYSDHVTAVNADGGFIFDRLDANGRAFERYTADVDGNRSNRLILANGNNCVYAPNRNFLNFPLSVGKTWLSSWTQTCALGFQETATQLAGVTARETITLPAGSFDTLRVGYVTLFTKSNDLNLVNGDKGTASYLQESTCWWSVDAKRVVKCSFKNTFNGAAPASYLTSYTLEANFVGKQYFAGAKQVGQNNAWTETDTLVDGSPLTRNYNQIVRAVNPDGSHSADYVDPNGALTERYTYDKDDNRLSRYIASIANTCSYSPRRDFFDFPLYVGKSWSTSWLYNCSSGYHENAAHTAQVEALESVTVGAGTFDALRIHFQTQFTNSNDAGLANGLSGSAAYSQEGACWWAPALQRMIKCDITSDFGATAPASYRKHYAMEVTAVVVP